jgi:hypothetical protein
LNHQTTICFVLWPSSFMVKSFNLQRTWKFRLKKFLVPKIKSRFSRHSRHWPENGRRPLNMRACTLNIELLLFCMFWAINVFILNPLLFTGQSQ